MPDSKDLGKIINFRGYNIAKSDVNVLQELEDTVLYKEKIRIDKYHAIALKDLEDAIGKPIPLLDEININTLGFTLKDHKIISLGIPKCGMKYLPKSLGNIESLRFLNLENNKLKNLQDWFFNLASLEELYLKENKIEYLSNKIGELSRIVKLDISNNILQNIPDEIGNMKQIQHLNLENNLIIDIPISITNLIRLDKLNLNNNALPKEVSNRYKGMALKAKGRVFDFLHKIAEACKRGEKKEPLLKHLKTYLAPLVYAALIAWIGLFSFVIINSLFPNFYINLFFVFFLASIMINFIIGISIISTLSGYYKNFIEKTGSSEAAQNLRGRLFRNFDVFVFIYLVWSVRAVIKTITEIEIVPTVDFMFEISIPEWMLNVLIFIGYNIKLTFLENVDIFLGYFWLKLFSTALIFWALFRNGLSYIGKTAFDTEKEKKVYSFLIFGLFGAFALAIVRFSTFWVFLNIAYSIGIIIGGSLFIIGKYSEERKVSGKKEVVREKKKAYLMLIYIGMAMFIVWVFSLWNLLIAFIFGLIFVIFFFIIKFILSKTERFENLQKLRELEQIAARFENLEVMLHNAELDNEEITEEEQLDFELEDISILAKKSFKAVENVQWDSKSEFRIIKNRITEIGINNSILSKIPDSFKQLTKVRSIYLNYNKLKTLPETFNELNELELLYVIGNQLEELPNSIGSLPLLKELSLSNNNINRIPQSIGALQSLTKLDISKNNLETLPNTIENINNLNELDIRSNILKRAAEEILSNLEEKGVAVFR